MQELGGNTFVTTSCSGCCDLDTGSFVSQQFRATAICACRFPLGDTVLLSVGQASVYHVLGSVRQPYDAEGPVEDIPRR